jgi:transposase InsO family protein
VWAQSGHSPEQNGMVERFLLTLKQECVWLQRFEDRDHAFRVIADWLDRYHAERPHSAFGYLTPSEHRALYGNQGNPTSCATLRVVKSATDQNIR